MHDLALVWLRRNSFSWVITGLAALAMGGCPPVGPGTGNTNDNTTPPGQDLIVVDVSGQGTVDQTANGNMVTLTAAPASGWAFNGWSGADGVDQAANPLVVDATQISSITANFIQGNEPPPRPLNVCGDGVVDRSEQCDDGNTVDGDGCSSTCQIETPSSARCGDGVVNGTEECDGGGETSTCNADCTTSRCGDGVKNVHAGEQCDDGNTVNGDGCSSACHTETPPPSGCGDGVVNGTEDCDGGGRETATCNANCTTSRCGDGIVNTKAAEQCDDGNRVNGDGCSSTCQIETTTPPPPPPPATCGNGTVDAGEECDGGGETALCNSNCKLSRCGDGIVNAHSGEQCDDGNTVNGDGCASNCQNEPPPSGIPNDNCGAAIAIGDGTRSYSNLGATTDGPDEPTMCSFFSRTNVESDIWYCYTATCTGTAFVGLCGSSYDTKLAVYAGCDCPTAPPLACSDDDCGAGVENVQSRVTLAVTTGQKYLVRVGGFLGEQGDGRLTIGCNVDTCAHGSGDCLAASPSQAPGCGDAACCGKTCALDQFCCDVTWDATCAGEAQGVCSGSFAACAPQTGACNAPDNTPGCDNVSCCNTVCMVDPFCCLTSWDSTCVDEANSKCFLTCGAGAGGCHATHTTPGCVTDACCQAICTQDAFCCDTAWDQTCVDKAAADPACP